ncbi:MAG: VOC family protein [Baekduia sp.]
MLDHVTIRVSDVAASRAFYDPLLTELGIDPAPDDADFIEWEAFGIAQADADHGVTRGHHIGLRAPSREQVDAFYLRGIALGAEPDGEPGERPQYGDDYYGAFLRDPDGGSIEAVWGSGTGTRGLIDHLTIRVPDLGASRAFALALAELVGWHVRADEARRFRIGDGETAAISFLDDPGREPATGLHVGFGVDSGEAVHSFHDQLVAAGYRSDGEPGPRPEYSPGYYGCFVLGPCGNSYEAMARVFS